MFCALLLLAAGGQRPDFSAMTKAADALLPSRDYTFRFVRMETFTYGGKPATATWGMGVLKHQKSGVIDDTGFAECRFMAKGEGLSRDLSVPNSKLFLPKLIEQLKELAGDSRVSGFAGLSRGDYYSPEINVVFNGSTLPTLFTDGNKGKLPFPLAAELLDGTQLYKFYVSDVRPTEPSAVDALFLKFAGFVEELKPVETGNPWTYTYMGAGRRGFLPCRGALYVGPKYTFAVSCMAGAAGEVPAEFSLRSGK